MTRMMLDFVRCRLRHGRALRWFALPWFALSAFALLGASACAGGGQSASLPAGPPGTFSEIYTTVLSVDTESRCNFCHSMPASQVSNGTFHTGKDASETYASILDRISTSSACGGRELIVPGAPEESLLFLKISGQPPCGNRMPLGGKALSDEQVQMIRSWIAAGAEDN
jgi:hypothetical protein